MMASRIRRMVAPAGRGSVLIIALLLLSSASIRLLTSANTAFAQDGQLPTAPMPAPPEVSDAPVAHETLTGDVQKSSFGSGTDRGAMSALVTALTEREANVAKREQQLEMRLRALAVADAEIEKRLQSLSNTEQKLRATLSLADEASEKDILRLTTVYENMKPKDAAILFEEMEPNFAAGFLGRMRPEVAAQVLAGLSPPAAYSISVILAGRNANAPKT